MSNPEKLTCVSILICDDVYRDEKTKKLVIVGTFNNIYAHKFPCINPRMRVLFTVTNAKGHYDLWLSIEHEASGHRVAAVGGPLDVSDPLAISDIDIELRQLRFDQPGKYWVILTADGEIIQQRPFWVHQVQESAP